MDYLDNSEDKLMNKLNEDKIIDNELESKRDH